MLFPKLVEQSINCILGNERIEKKRNWNVGVLAPMWMWARCPYKLICRCRMNINSSVFPRKIAFSTFLTSWESRKSPLNGLKLIGFFSSVNSATPWSSSPFTNSSEPPRDDRVLLFIFLSPRKEAIEFSSVALGLNVPVDIFSLELHLLSCWESFSSWSEATERDCRCLPLDTDIVVWTVKPEVGFPIEWYTIRKQGRNWYSSEQ